MSTAEFSAIENFPTEGALAGKIVLYYGELEYALCLCLSAVMDDSEHEDRLNRAARAFYRTRGEEARIVMADALMRTKYESANLDPPYSELIADLRYCKAIRNQYAHCHWTSLVNGQLCHFSFEEGANQRAGFTMQAYPASIELLERQLAFCNFVYTGLMLLNRHYEHFVGRDERWAFPFPTKLNRPLLHNPPL